MTGCVVWDQREEEYHVFVTTDTQVSARQMIMTYELRPEIEEDYRQIKGFWNIEDFKSRKKTVIAFYIVCTLLGYLLFQLYAQSLEGEQWAGKSLPVALKKFKTSDSVSVIICVGQFFAVYTLFDIMQLYASLDAGVRARLDRVLAFAWHGVALYPYFRIAAGFRRTLLNQPYSCILINQYAAFPFYLSQTRRAFDAPL